MTAASYPEQGTARPPRGLYVGGIVLAVFAVLIPLLALVGVFLGLRLRSQGWAREGTIIASVNAAIGVVAAIAWYVLAYS
jgi:hypothetical protein